MEKSCEYRNTLSLILSLFLIKSNENPIKETVKLLRNFGTRNGWKSKKLFVLDIGVGERWGQGGDVGGSCGSSKGALFAFK